MLGMLNGKSDVLRNLALSPYLILPSSWLVAVQPKCYTSKSSSHAVCTGRLTDQSKESRRKAGMKPRPTMRTARPRLRIFKLPLRIPELKARPLAIHGNNHKHFRIWVELILAASNIWWSLRVIADNQTRAAGAKYRCSSVPRYNKP